MKKIITLILVMFMVLGILSSCNKNDDTTDSIPSVEPVTEMTQQPINNSDFEESATPEPLNETVAKWEDSLFISEWGKFSIQMPESWSKATDEEIRLVQNLGAEMYAGVDSLELEDLENLNYIYPMMISKYPLTQYVEGFNTNLIVVFEKLSTINILMVNGKTYLETVKSQYEEMDIGYEFNTPIKDVKLDGEKFYSMTMEHEEAGLRQTIVCRKHKGFIVAMIISASVNEQADIDMLLDNIKKD